MAFSQIQYGSKGADVARLQNYLNKYGYKLTVDGDFGTKTQEAVRAYQRNNGLTVDGIVGDKTWGALKSGTNNKTSGGSTSTTTSMPTLSANPTNPVYDTSSYKDSTAGDANWKAYQDALNKVNTYGDFKYGNQEQLDEIMKSILNREKFSYDLNGDALYQQYKNKYTQQAKMAMGDAIGQASAMTGGYGNSYAQSVGQQMYQKEMQNLNDIVPELYQMAYDKYNQEGQDLYNQYGMLTDDYDRGYAKHMDGYNQLMDMLGIKRSDYYDGADLFYTEQSNKNSVADKEFNNAMEILNRNDSNAWAEAEWNRDQTWRDEDIKREDARWEVEDEQWQKTYDAMYGDKTTDDTAPGGIPGGTDDQPGGSYDNQGYSDSIVKQAQKYVGASEDGKWGPNSAAKAKAKGYNSLAEVVAAAGLREAKGPVYAPFTGKSYADAITYMKENGIDLTSMNGLLNEAEWLRHQHSYFTTGQGGAEVTEYSSYAEYMQDYIRYVTGG